MDELSFHDLLVAIGNTASCEVVRGDLYLHAIAREVDAAAGLLLRTSLDLEHFVPEALRLVDVSALALAVATWCAAGVTLWLALAAFDGGGPDPRHRSARLFLRIGQTLTVLVDGHGDDGTAIARSAADAPEIDGTVRIADGRGLEVGQFTRVRVTGSDEHDLTASRAA